MADSLPSLSEFCVVMSTGPGELCIEFPGGTKICAGVGYEIGDTLGITKSLIDNVNTALMPLMPIFDILDILKKIFDCLSAVPDAITNLDPTALLQCMPELASKIDSILKFLPMMSMPYLIKSFLNVVIEFLLGLRQELGAILKQQQRLLTAATKAATLGNVELQLAVDCASGNLDAQLQNMNSSLKPINRLIGIINVLLNMVGLPCVPTIGELTGDLDDALYSVIDSAIAILQQIRALISVPELALPPIPAPTDPCS